MMENTNLNQNAATQSQAQVPPQGPGAPQGAPQGAQPFNPVQRPVYAPKIKWPPIASDSFDAVFMILTLIYSVFAVHAVFFAGFFKLGFTVAYALWFIVESIYIFSKNKPKITLYPLIMGALSLGASGVFALYNDEAINFALLLFMAFANAEYFLLLSKQDRFKAGEISAVLDVARYLVVLPIEFFTEPFRSAFSAKAGEAKKGKGKVTGQVLIGIAIALPIAALLITLLSSADEAFKGLMSKIFSNLLLTLLKVVLGILIFPILLAPAFALRYKMPNREYKKPKERDFKRFPSAVSITVLAVIVLVYLVYLFSQLAYFFDAFKGILPEDFSMSEYARRGFFEMCAICAINAVIIMLSMAFSKNDSKGSTVIHKLFQIFIALVSLVIAASSFSKMYMYIERYGLTRKRILTSVFILMLCVVFITLIIRVLVKKFPYMKVIATCCFAILIAVGYIDIDSNIAKYNYQLYTTNSTIAKHYEKEGGGGFIEELGDSATEYIAKFAEEGKGDVKDRAQSWVCTMWGRENVKDYYYSSLSKCDTPLSYNRARVAATKVFDTFNEQYKFEAVISRLKDYGYDQYKSVLEDYPDYCYDYEYKANYAEEVYG